ncbi:hypothetical protein [Bradyrhizobium sp. RT9a]|uniref:hypothetical protein n=1 Tax=Bradyrhizobium sp. RT9a TaxID=3156384 RepID=UPI003392C30F
MPLLLKHLSRPRQHALQHDHTEQVGVAAEFAAYVAARQSGWKCSVNQDERASPGS